MINKVSVIIRMIIIIIIILIFKKIEKYKVLKDEITRMWDMKEVIVIPVVVGALGAISTRFEKYIAASEIEMRVKHAQKTVLLGTARILRLVLEC